MSRAKKETYKMGGGVGSKWIQGAIKNPGGLHKALHVSMGAKIPKTKIIKATHSQNPKIRKMANLAKTLGNMPLKHK
jgi:hypothetical protein